MTKTLGEWIQTCRNHAGKTQEQAAVALHISTRKYQGWELNEKMPTEDDLLRMEEYFENPIFAVKAMELKSPIWQKKAREASAAIIALHSIQTQLATIMPQLLGLADIAQTTLC